MHLSGTFGSGSFLRDDELSGTLLLLLLLLLLFSRPQGADSWHRQAGTYFAYEPIYFSEIINEEVS